MQNASCPFLLKNVQIPKNDEIVSYYCRIHEKCVLLQQFTN
jgi:hypothetical protein